MTFQDQPKTLCAAFQQTAAADPGAVAVRTVGDAQTLTWREYADQVRTYAAGLAALGVGHGDTIALMMTNRPEFHLIDAAAMHLGAIPFSMYNTCSAEQIAYLLDNAESRVVVCDQAFVDRVRAARGPVEHIVLADGDGDGDGALSLAQLVAGGDSGFDFDAAWQAVRPDDVATLIYTSGTTGNPKGVEITHANVLAEVEVITSAYDVRRGDRFTSYLPSAHVADRVASHYLQMIFGTQLTCVADAKMIGAALADVRPTYWFAVPRVWDKLKLALEMQFAAADGAQSAAWQRAMELGRKRFQAVQSGQRLAPDEEGEFAALSRAEQVKRFRILPAFWEPGGEEITPTMKLKRRPIAQKYASEIAGLYGPPGDGVHEVHGA